MKVKTLEDLQSDKSNLESALANVNVLIANYDTDQRRIAEAALIDFKTVQSAIVVPEKHKVHRLERMRTWLHAYHTTGTAVEDFQDLNDQLSQFSATAIQYENEYRDWLKSEFGYEEVFNIESEEAKDFGESMLYDLAAITDGTSRTTVYHAHNGWIIVAAYSIPATLFPEIVKFLG